MNESNSLFDNASSKDSLVKIPNRVYFKYSYSLNKLYKEAGIILKSLIVLNSFPSLSKRGFAVKIMELKGK